MSASGVSLARISAYLEDMDISSQKGKKTWRKKPGNVALQKTFVENYLEYKQIKNKGQLDIYQMMGNHEAIICPN